MPSTSPKLLNLTGQIIIMTTSLIEMLVTKFWSHDHIYKRPRVANFADITKIATIFLKQPLKTKKN